MEGAEQVMGARSGPAEVVVVTPDGGRRALYRGALRMAGIPAVFPEGSEEAEARLADGPPAALVLDHGLPRAAVLQLYGMARDSQEAPRVPILFVGQDGESDGADHFLPGEPSPLAVAERIGELVAPADQSDAAEPATPGKPKAAERLVGARASAGAPTPAEAAPPEPVAAAAAPPPIQGRRLDVIMLRIGIVLFLLGVAVLFFRMESLPRALLPPPTAVPTTPTPGQKPSGQLPGWQGRAFVLHIPADGTPSA